MKKNVLYIGNYLKDKKRNASYMFTLGHLLSQEGYKLTYASRYNNKMMRLLHMFYKVVVKRNQTDYVLIDTYSTQNFYYAVLVSKLCFWFKLPYIPILHGGNLPQRLKASQKLSRVLFNNALINVSPSLYLKTAFAKHGYKNVVHIPNTINIESYPFKPRTVSTINLLWVRSFSVIYNPILAVKVLKTLIEKGYEAELSMVGPDSDGSLAKVKQYCNVNNLKVNFTGKLTKQEWIALSQQYHVFINTSSFDNTPLSVIEAMALGLPVVSTNIGGMPYLIEHGKEGLLVNPDNEVEMAEAILQLYKNENLAKTISNNARQKVEMFDWELIKHQWFDVLS